MSFGDSSATIRSMPIKSYFDEMLLTKQQKAERISLANDIEDAMLFFFSLVILQREYAYLAGISVIDVKEQFRSRMHEVVERHAELTPELISHIDECVDDIVQITTEHVEILLALMDDSEDSIHLESAKKTEEYYLSDDRARLFGEEESNTIFNNVDYWKAKRLGRTKKTWVTMRDSRVRVTHQEIEDKTIPIDELFLVGNSFMRYPRDTKYGANIREILGCRCSCVYK